MPPCRWRNTRPQPTIILKHLAADGLKNVAEYMADFDSLAVAGKLEDHHPHYFLTAALDSLSAA